MEGLTTVKIFCLIIHWDSLCVAAYCMYARVCPYPCVCVCLYGVCGGVCCVWGMCYRYRQYLDSTMPIVNKFKERGLLRTISGVPSADDVRPK